MNIQDLVKKVLPPSDYEHRNGFNNVPLIDELDAQTRNDLEDALIEKLTSQSPTDIYTLLIDTLAYMKSAASIPILSELLSRCSDNLVKIGLAAAVYQVCGDSEVIPIALSSIEQIDSKKSSYRVYSLISAFYYVAEFRAEETNTVLRNFANSDDYLISYNAKRALALQEVDQT